MFKQPSCRHPIFPDVNYTQPDGPAAALGGRTLPARVPDIIPAGTPVALRPELRLKRRAESHRERSRSITGRKVKIMGGVLLCAGAVAVLVGLGALVEATRGRRRTRGRRPALAKAEHVAGRS
jgi:hypothetical protein